METSLHTQAIADWLGLFTCMCGRRWAVLTVGQRLEQDPLERTPLPHRSPTITITATVQASSSYIFYSLNIFDLDFYVTVCLGITSFVGGRPKPTPCLKLFSFLYPKSKLDATITMADKEHHESLLSFLYSFLFTSSKKTLKLTRAAFCAQCFKIL